MEEIDFLSKANVNLKAKTKKFSCLSLKTKSGNLEDLPTDNSVLGPLENYEIEPSSSSSSPDRIQMLKQSVAFKRLHDGRPKLATSLMQTNSSKLNESGIDGLQDTLDCLDVTKIIMESSKKENVPKELSQRFDAFKDYFEKELVNDKENITAKLFPINNKELVPSQSEYSPQVARQLDTAFSLEETSPVRQVEDAGNVSVFKIPQMEPVSKKIKTSSISDQSDMFNNEKLTTQYRQQVDHLFEQLEHSIYAMGAAAPEGSALLSDQVLNEILTGEDTLVNAMGADASFNTVIKKALLVNAAQAFRPLQVVENAAVNSSLVAGKRVFGSIGPFYGLPNKVLQLIQQYKGIDKLYDWQDECLKLPAVASRKNLIYALPTSGGKTLVAEILMLRETMCCKRNVLFILPYVAIVQEKVWSLSPFAVALDFLVEEYASSKGSCPPRRRRRKNSIYIATIEKALSLTNSLIEHGRLSELGLIVVDELHLVGDQGRGPTLESLLAKMMYLKADIQIVGMSATIGNIEDIRKFLDADVYTNNFRPVELTEFVKCGNQMNRINWSHTNERDLLVDAKKLDYKYPEDISKIDPDMLGGLVMDVVPKSSCLIFCASKKNCENVAHLLARIVKRELKELKKTEKQQLIHALKDESGGLCNVLKMSLPVGIAYHHSGLTSDERRLIEDGFRAGIINVICCTSTLAAGVNLPARRVILRSPYVGRDFINLVKYKQMVGRAGRAGLGEAGDSILVTTPLDLPKVRDLLLSPMNQALSSMHELDGKGLRHFLLSCISLGVAVTRLELQVVTSKTLMAVQCEKLGVDCKQLTDIVIRNLFKLGALEVNKNTIKPREQAKALADVSVKISVKMDTSTLLETSESAANPSVKKKKTVVVTNRTKLVVSPLGTAAIKGGFELSRAHMLYEDLHQAQSSLVLLDCLHLLYLITPYDTAEQIKPNMQVYYDVFTHLGPHELQTAKILGMTESLAVKMLSGAAITIVPKRILNRFYVALMLYDLWNEKAVFQVAEKFQVSRGIVQNLMTNSATFASNVVYFCEQLEEFWAFSHLLKGMNQKLSHCCLKELQPLMELPAVKQGRAKQLYNAGYKNLQSIAKANANELEEAIEFMSRRVANQLIAAAKMLLLEKVENLREEAEDVLDGVENPRQLFNISKN